MVTLLKVSTRKAAAVRKSTQILYLFIGFGLITMVMVAPPVKALWVASASLLGAVLVLFSIVGLSPRLKVSGFGSIINNTTFQVVVNVLIGMGIIIAAMIKPPVHMAWFGFFILVGALLVFDAIITSTWHPAESKKGDTKHMQPPHV